MNDTMTIRTLDPVDAVGLSACIQRCYGDSYPKRIMYQPEALAEVIRTHTYNGVVALAGADVVGHIGFSWPNPAASVVEAGTTVVDSNHRGGGLMGRLVAVLGKDIVAAGAVGLVHFPTTAHTVMQKASLQSGGRETGVMLAFMPPEARDIAFGSAGVDRLAVTAVYQPLVEAPATEIYFPKRYRDLIVGLADQLQLRRSSAGAFAAPCGPTQIHTNSDEHRKAQNLTIERIGHDLADAVAEAIQGSQSTLIQVDLNMDEPQIDFATETLRAAGFAFSAWLPGWSRSDVLRFQLPKSATEGELHPTLLSDAANDLAALIRRELITVPL